MQTFTPKQYLKIDIANQFGLDKEDWDTRITWFDEHREVIELDPKHPALRELIREAENPAMFFAGSQAWKAAQAGQEIGYAISLDATASGAQILSILIGDEKSARLCNVVDTGHREDLYTNVFKLMSNRIADLLADPLDRSPVKTAVMTGLYGSQAEPRKAFPNPSRLQAFYQTMEEDLTGIWQLNNWLLDRWDPTAFSYDWVLPDNFHVHTKVENDVQGVFGFAGEGYQFKYTVNMPSLEGKSIAANVVHSIDGLLVREVMRRCSYDTTQIDKVRFLLRKPFLHALPKDRPQDELLKTLWSHYQDMGFFSARILDLIDENNLHLIDREPLLKLLDTLPKAPFPVLSVHDCFRVHPNHANDLRRTVNQVMHEIAASEMLSFITSQLVGYLQPITKMADIADRVLEANYILS